MNNTKKLALGTLLSLLTLSLIAQTGGGSLLLGGSSSLSLSSATQKFKSDDGDNTAGKNTKISLAPQLGYFVVNGLAVGLALEVDWESFKPEGAEADPSSTVIALLFVRYYVGNSKIKPFAETALGIGNKKYYTYGYEGEKFKVKKDIFAFRFKGGVAAFLNDNVSIDLGIEYSSLSLKKKENNDNNFREVLGGLGLELGVMVVL